MVLLCQSFSFACLGFRVQMWLSGEPLNCEVPLGATIGVRRSNLGHGGGWLALSSDMLFHCCVTRGSWPQWVRRLGVLIAASDTVPLECWDCSMSYDISGLEVIGGDSRTTAEPAAGTERWNCIQVLLKSLLRKILAY